MSDIYPSGFESHRELAIKTGDGLDMVISTGYALFGMKGAAGGAWNHQDLCFRVGPQWGFLQVEGTTVVVSPSSMYNIRTATNAGWAVDRVGVSYFQQVPGPPGVQVSLRCGLAVSDSDGILYRVNYHVTTVGRLFEQAEGTSHELIAASELAVAHAETGPSADLPVAGVAAVG